MKLKLPDGLSYYHDADNVRRCNGSQMGRRNTKPSDLPCGDWKPGTKLHLMRVPFIDYCYDQGGAYWGLPANLYVATEGAVTYSPLAKRFELIPCGVTVYVRASSREYAKHEVLKIVPDAKFYR